MTQKLPKEAKIVLLFFSELARQFPCIQQLQAMVLMTLFLLKQTPLTHSILFDPQSINMSYHKSSQVFTPTVNISVSPTA